MCQCFYCTNGKVTTPPDVKSFEDFVDLTTVTCKLGHKTGCKYCVDFHDVEEKKSRKKEENMQTFHAMNDWGIYVSHDEVLNGTLDRAKLEEAGYQLIHPHSGCVYFDDSGEYLETETPFWFLPIQQPGLFDTFYEGIEDIAAEVEPLYPEVFFNLNVAERLVRANVVWTE